MGCTMYPTNADTEAMTAWTQLSSIKKKQYIERQLELIESTEIDTRRDAQSRLLYLLQGSFIPLGGS